MGPKVFIASSKAALQIAEHAQAALSDLADVEKWTDGLFRNHATPIENLFEILERFQFALMIVIPEDFTITKSDERWTMRDNVLFEAGLFLGRLGRHRVFMLSPTGGEALSLPSDLKGVEPCFYNSNSENQRAAVSTALVQMREALRKYSTAGFVHIFDSSRGLDTHQVIFKSGRKWSADGKTAVGGAAEGEGRLIDRTIEIQRHSSQGVFEIELRPNGIVEPSVSKIRGSDRIFNFRLEARVENTPHLIRMIAIKDQDHHWFSHREFEIKNTQWKQIAGALHAPRNANLILRIDDEVPESFSGRLFLKNIQIHEIVN